MTSVQAHEVNEGGGTSLRPGSVAIDLRVVGTGLASSLGTARQACAAARAGLSRPLSLVDRPRFDRAGSPDPITAHVITEMGEGFQGLGRLVVLAQRAVADLKRCLSIHSGRVGLFLVLPDRRLLGIDPDAPEAVVPDQVVEDEFMIAIARAVASSLEIKLAHVERIDLGAIGTFSALSQAEAAITSGSIDLAVVGAIDSLVDGEALEWLARARRLKSSERSDGLFPGEGAAFVAFAAPAAEAAGSYHIAYQVEPEPAHAAWRKHGGRGWLPLLGAVLSDVPTSDPLRVLSDANGEAFRFVHLGAVRTHLGRLGRVVAAEDMPATRFGDTGSCAPLLALLLFLHGQERGVGKGEVGLILCAADLGGRAAASIRFRGRE